MILGILTDIHEDAGALKNAINIFRQKNCDELVCLGDILGFDPTFYSKVKQRNASECIHIIKNEFKHVVVGNHDLFAIKKIPRNTGVFHYPNNWYNLTFDERRKLSHNKIWLYENEHLVNELNEIEFNFINSLPDKKILSIKKTKVLFSHSIFPDFSGSYFFRIHNPWELREHFNFMKSNKIDFGFSGHAHPNFLMQCSVNILNRLSYNKKFAMNSLNQYICQNLAYTKGKNGIVIADFNNMEIETIEINKFFENKVFPLFYGKKEKNN